MQLFVVDANLSDREAQVLQDLIGTIVSGFCKGSSPYQVNSWEVEPHGWDVVRDQPVKIVCRSPRDPQLEIEMHFSSREERALYDAAVDLKRSRQSS